MTRQKNRIKNSSVYEQVDTNSFTISTHTHTCKQAHTHTQYSTVPSTFLSLSLTRFLIAFLGSPLALKKAALKADKNERVFSQLLLALLLFFTL